MRPGLWGYWVQGIFFVDSTGQGHDTRYSIQFYSFGAGRLTEYAPLAKPVWTCHRTAAGSFYTQQGQTGSDIMLVENFGEGGHNTH